MRGKGMICAALLGTLGLTLPLSGAPPVPALAEDRGKLRILQDGQLMGTEEFSIGRSGQAWMCHGSVELKIPGAGSASVSSQMQLSAEGALQQYTWTSKSDRKVTGGVIFSGSVAQLEVRVDNTQPYSQEFQFDSTRIVILDNNLFHHYLILAQLYDWNTRGSQTFSVLIPQALTPGTIAVEWGGSTEVDGAKMDLLRVRSPDLEVEIYVAAGKVMRLAVPSAKVLIQREGAVKAQ
jgi:hypothetical protein